MPPADPSRILLIRPSALGDVCRTSPVLASLRRRFPKARIDWLVRDAFADAVRGHPSVTGLLPFPRGGMHRWWTPRGMRTTRDFLASIAAPHYDLVIDCQGLVRSGVFSIASGAAKRIGDRHAAEFSWLAYTDRVRTDPKTHVVDQMLALANSAGAEPIADMRLYTPPDVMTPSSELQRDAYAVIAPTSAWPGKCWPADRFAELAKRLLDEGVVERIAIVGGGNERHQVEALTDFSRQDSRVLDLVGQTSVGQLMHVIEHAALVIANDSAAMHMAVGFDRPLVALLGPTNAALAGPYGRLDSVAQVVTSDDRLTHRACKDAAYGASLMKRIRVDTALERALEQVKRTDRRAVEDRASTTAGAAAP